MDATRSLTEIDNGIAFYKGSVAMYDKWVEITNDATPLDDDHAKYLKELAANWEEVKLDRLKILDDLMAQRIALYPDAPPFEFKPDQFYWRGISAESESP